MMSVNPLAPIISAANTFKFIYFLFFIENKFDISCESSAWKMIHMKCQHIFSMKNKKKLKKIDCCLLQILFGALRENNSR